MPGQYNLSDVQPEQPAAGTGQYKLSDAAPTPQDPGVGKGLYETTLGPLVDFGKALISDPKGAISGVGAGLQKALIEEPWDYAKKTGQAMVHGDVPGVVRNAPGMVPIFGPAAEHVTDTAESGQPMRAVGQAASLLGSAALPEAAAALRGPAASAVGTAATEALGKTTGAGAAAMRRALENPSPDLENAMRGGMTDTELVGNFRDAMQNVKDARGAAYRQQLANLPMSGPGTSLDISPIRSNLATQLQKFNIKIDPQGELDFSRSTIRDAAAQTDVKGIYDDVIGWGKQAGDRTPAGVDTLKRRIDDTYSPSSTARAIVQSVKDTTRNVLNSQVPGYADMTQQYAQSSKFLDQLKDLSLDSPNSGTAVRKLTTLLNQNNGYRQMLAERLSSFTPQDLEGQLAGMNLSKFAPRGLMGPGTGMGIAFGVATHALSPQAAVGLAMTSPRLMGELLTLVAKTPEIPASVGRAASVAIPAGAAASVPRTITINPRPSLPMAAANGQPSQTGPLAIAAGL